MYEPKNFDNLLGAEGFGDALLKNHFALYQGYVANTNKSIEIIKALFRDKKSDTPEFAEVKRRFGWEFNGMRLHELYFGNMAKKGIAIDKGSALFRKIAEEFGSYEEWEKEFRATGAIRGIGWVALYYEPIAKRLFNAWINEHDAGHLSTAHCILLMDVFEHAFMIDYGLKRADYVSAFFRAVDWKAAAKRYDAANK